LQGEWKADDETDDEGEDGELLGEDGMICVCWQLIRWIVWLVLMRAGEPGMEDMGENESTKESFKPEWKTPLEEESAASAELLLLLLLSSWYWCCC
jgi:hypothetical protein